MDNRDIILGQQRMINAQQEAIKCIIQIIEIVCQNAGYSRSADEDMLIDHQTYFDICQLIFSELSIKIIKIQQHTDTTPGTKLQQLIDLLVEELQIDLDIDGQEIVRFNLEHIHRIVQFLYEYSKIYVRSKIPVEQVKSNDEGKRSKDTERPIFNSARGPRKKEKQKNQHNHNHNNNRRQQIQQIQPLDYHQQNKQPVEEEESYLIPQKVKKRKPQYSGKAKRARSHQLQNKNLHLGVVHKIMQQKTKMLRAATRDNRKSRLQAIKQAKNAYKIYLKRYTKENKAQNGKKKSLKQKSTVKPISQQLPQKDFEVIDKFFESFTYKFRDKKSAYLRKIQKLAHQQQLDRYCYQNRMQREARKSMNDRLVQDLKCQTHQHRVRSNVLRESSKALDQNIINIRKEMKLHDSRNKKQMKETKKAQLQQIQNKIRQDNEKMLMNLEEGGRLQKIIMQMYKRF